MSWFWGSSSRHRRPGYARSSSGFSSVFSSHSGRHGSSYYKRRSRDGYIERLVYKLRHLIRELWYYARRNPIKVFIFVILPLISGGTLAAAAGKFGIRLPEFLQGRAAREVADAGGYYGSRGYGGGGAEDVLKGVAGGAGGIGTILGLAKMFL